MKLHPAISAKLAGLQPNHVGLLPWSLLAYPLPMQAGAYLTSQIPMTRSHRTPVKSHLWSRASRPCLTSRHPRLWPEQRGNGLPGQLPSR